MCRNHLPRQAVRLASARKAAAIFPRHHGHGGIFEGAAGIGVGTIDIGFERIAAEPSIAEVRWFRGGLLLDTGALDL